MVRRDVRIWLGTVFCLLFQGALGVAVAAEGGVGSLLVAPTRVVLEARQRSAELNLMNRGTRAETYRLEVVERHMTDDGRLESLPEDHPAPHSAAAMVRFSPRQVTLAPGETQKVRLMARRPAGLADGEYRSHLMIRTLPLPGEAPAADSSLTEGQLSVKLITTTAVTLPLIVRHGETRFEVTVEDLALVEPPGAGGPPFLGLRLRRTGTRSAYGDFTVEWEPAAGGATVTVGRMRGVALYTPNPSRSVEVPLTEARGSLLAGTVRIAYRSPGDDQGNPLASAELTVD